MREWCVVSVGSILDHEKRASWCSRSVLVGGDDCGLREVD